MLAKTFACLSCSVAIIKANAHLVSNPNISDSILLLLSLPFLAALLLQYPRASVLLGASQGCDLPHPVHSYMKQNLQV